MLLGKHPIPEVAMEFMNRDHQAFIDQVELLEKLLASLHDIQLIDQHLKELHEHTRNHFATEEKGMLVISFPPYPVHQQEHERMLSEMIEQIEAWKNERDAERLSQYVKETLPMWLAQHVQTMDFVTAMWLSRG
jgi:hemerythrin-like metal-binding protein